MDRPADLQPQPDVPAAAAPRTEPRQRWRIVFARDAGAPPLTQRELGAATDAALAESGLPLVEAGRNRSRLLFGAPLPVTMAAECELADLYLAERRPVHEVRAAAAALLPPGYRLVDLFDVWIGEPALAGQVAAADYRIALGEDVPAAEVARAAETLLGAAALPRERPKGGGTVRYDLRPLVADVAVVDDGPPVAVRARTRFHPELGAGRPEEVLAALADLAGVTLTAREIVRERVLLIGELDARSAGGV